jgi:hypothetical protein
MGERARYFFIARFSFAFSIGYSLALNSGMTLWVDRHRIRIVKRRAEGVEHTVAQFAPFVNRAWCF